MKTLKTFIASIGLIFPAAAFAQSAGDSAQSAGNSTYCTSLSHQYQKYVAGSNDKSGNEMPGEVAVAMGSCASSNVTWAIATLEKALTDERIKLPPRT